MNTITINARDKKSKISKNIYGHFSEHLGRCIYDGLYVGEDSAIPNKNGMRTDVVRGFKEHTGACASLARRMLCG